MDNMDNIEFDFSDVKRTLEEIEEKYRRKYLNMASTWETVFENDTLGIRISKDSKFVEINVFEDNHWKVGHVIDAYTGEVVIEK